MCPSASLPDLLTSVKLLASPTVEIAAASVGERSLVDVVRQIEEEGKSTDSTVDVAGPEIQEVPAEAVADEAAVEEAAEESKEGTKVVEGDLEGTEAPAAEEETPASSTAAEGDEEKTVAPPPEELAAPTEEQVGEAEADAARVETQSPEEPVTTEEAPPAEEVTAAADEVAAAPDEAEEHTAEDAGMVQLAEASAEADAEVPLAAESEPEAAVHEAESCHCAPPADHPAPPVAAEDVLACEETMDSTLESEEQVAPSK